ncbi:acetylxylan esterase [Microbacterium sp. cx-55]|nr:acetylxylan esterase [Microbacterium sp. cx-55]MBZ4486963.1 acetylxylan esterase [Microbacterium sp. cx-55]UGB35882.1 acetylxylan esterase [Microbacterium sp. cx-55]
MALTHTDLPLDLLREYAPDLPVPDDLDDFWRRTLEESRAAGGEVRIEPVAQPITELVVEDLTFPGFAGEPVKAWITRPPGDEPRATVVEYLGYSGGRGLPGERLAWAAAGYVHVLMDTRGQGSGWGSGGDTPDPHGSGPAVAGYMTRGISSPDTYYYRRLFTDAVQVLDAVVDLPFVDAARIAVTGVSQGGGTAIAAAALSPHARAVLPDVPFLCDFPRSITRTPEAPFTEITRYLAVHKDAAAEVLRTLSYFDGAVLARRITVPALFSVGLMDEVVLPGSVFAAFNALSASDAHIEVYGFNGHEGGGFRHWHRQVEWLRARF